MKNLFSISDPDNSVKEKYQRLYLSLHVISINCEAIKLTNLKHFDPEPEWFGPLNSSLQTAKQHASEWGTNIHLDITKSVPTSILFYTPFFNVVTDQILELLSKTPSEESNNTELAINYLHELTKKIGNVKEQLDKTKEILSAFSQKLKEDHEALFEGVNSVQKAIVIENNEIDKLNADINQLQTSIQQENQELMEAELSTSGGIFGFAVGVAVCLIPGGALVGAITIGAAALAIGIGGGYWGTLVQEISSQSDKIIADNDQIEKDRAIVISLGAIYSSCEHTLKWIEDTIDSLTEVQNIWNDHAQEVSTLIDKLNAPDAKMPIILDQIYIKEARSRWQDLTEFAEQLLVTSYNVEIQELPVNSAA